MLALVSLLALAICAGTKQGARAADETSVHTEDIRIAVNDPDTEFITGALSLPLGPGPFPAVIILHTCSGVNVDAGIVSRVIADYLPKGIATLVIDSFHPRGFTGVCEATYRISPHRRAEDAYAALAWLTRRKDIDSKHVFLQGYSHGAAAAIDAIDAPNAATHAPRFAGAIAFYPNCSTTTKFSVPTLILIGELDDWTPPSRCQAIEDKTNVEITVYPGATHAFAMPGLDMTYLGHRVAYQEAAAKDAQRRAASLIDALIRQTR
jgi:dienelactone hydrolase